MALPGKAGFKEAWQILKEVDDALSAEKDARGQVKPTGEGRALVKMQNQLQVEISKDATAYLKSKGFTGGGMKARPARNKR